MSFSLIWGSHPMVLMGSSKETTGCGRGGLFFPNQAALEGFLQFGLRLKESYRVGRGNRFPRNFSGELVPPGYYRWFPRDESGEPVPPGYSRWFPERFLSVFLWPNTRGEPSGGARGTGSLERRNTIS